MQARQKWIAVIAVAVAAFLSGAIQAAELAGVWTVTSEGRNGPRTSELTIRQDGDAYAGTIKGERGEAEIATINFDADKSTFDFVVTMEGRFLDIDVTYKGTLSGDAIEGSIDTPMGSAPFTGTRKVE